MSAMFSNSFRLAAEEEQLFDGFGESSSLHNLTDDFELNSGTSEFEVYLYRSPHLASSIMTCTNSRRLHPCHPPISTHNTSMKQQICSI